MKERRWPECDALDKLNIREDVSLQVSFVNLTSSDWGFEIKRIHGGTQLLQLWRKHNILILLDIWE